MAKATKGKLTIEETLKALDKQYGTKSVIHGNQVEKPDIVISTGSLGLDIATGIGGIPLSTPEKGMGRIIELKGWESSGKSTLVQTIIANVQKSGKKVLLVDSENSLDATYASAIGVDLDNLYLVQLDEGAGEAAYDKMEKLVDTGEISLVVIDSYNALQPKKIIEDGLDAANMGLHARMMSKVMAKCNQQCAQYGTTFIFCGQLRQAIGVMYGDNSVTQGGNALRFYAHMVFDLSRSTTNDNSIFEGAKGASDKMGNLHKVHIKKNKLAPPFKKAEYNIIYGIGIDKYGEIIDLGKEHSVLSKRAGVITYDDSKFSEEDFTNLLVDNEEFFNEVRGKILDASKTKKIENTELQPEQVESIVEGLANDIEIE